MPSSQAFKRLRNGLLAGATSLGVKLLLGTLHYEVTGWERVKLQAWHGGGVIFCFWHNSIMIPLGHESHCNCVGVISRGRDGEFAARVLRHFGVGSLRGSSSRGGADLLLKIRGMRGQSQILAVTPDGPRGPRYQTAVGAVFLASSLGLPLAPLGMALSRSWKLQSWDRFRIPKPGARAVMTFGVPLHVPPALDRAALLRFKNELNDKLCHLSLEAAHKAGCAWPD